MSPGDRSAMEPLVRILVRAYPASFREASGEEMVALTLGRARRSPRGWRRARAWLGLLADLVVGAIAERAGRRMRLVSKGTRDARTARRRRRRAGRGFHGWDTTGRRVNRGEERVMGTWTHEIGSAVRRLRRAPGFALAAIAIVALGIGANTGVFTLVNAILLRPAPFFEAERVVRIYQDSDDGEPSSTSFPAYRDMKDFDVFVAVSAGTPAVVTWERAQEPTSAQVEFVTSGHLVVAGLEPALGRWFTEAEDEPGAGYFGVVSHRTWSDELGGDPAIVGSVVRLNGRPVTIVGVGPQGYAGSTGTLITDFWLSISSVELGGSFRVENLERRQDHWYDVMARLAPGVTVAQAQGAMDVLASRLAESYPELNEGRDITVFPASDVRVHPQVDASLAPAGLLLMGIAGTVLLLACSNLANLLLVRGIARGPEVAVRRALGASRGRVAALFLGEALLLALGGGVVGMVLARWAVDGFGSISGVLPIAGDLDLSMDVRVFLFAAMLVVACTVFFGLVPALRSMLTDPSRELGGDGRSAASARGTPALQGSLVTIQVAASVVLLVGASLLTRSLLNLQSVDPGFDPAGLAFLRTTTDVPGLGGETRLLEELRQAVAAAPGVEGAVLTSRPPLSFGGSTTTVVEGYEPPSGTGSVELDYAVVGEGYFELLGIPLRAGRAYGPDDGNAGASVVIVNEAAANRFWGGDAIGGRIRPQSAPGGWVEVVGVVADHAVEDLGRRAPPMLFYPAGRDGLRQGYVVARSAAAADDLLPILRRELRSVSATLPVSELGTMEGRVRQALRMPRLTALLLGGFALVALLLAGVGVYSVVSFGVARRTGELGIRLALGADGAGLVFEAVKGMLIFVTIGLGVGMGLAWVTAPLLRGLLVGLPPLDPASFAMAGFLLTGLACVAALIPARRAAGTNPSEALRGA